MTYAFPLHISWHCECGDVPESHVSRSDREECHGHCQSTPKACGTQGYRPIYHSGRTPAITAIFQAAGEKQWPKHYTSDLSVDYKMLIGWDDGREPAPERFVWVLRESGTHLFPLQTREQDQGIARGALRWLRENHPEALVYYWNGYALTPQNYDTVLTIAALPVPSGERCTHPSALDPEILCSVLKTEHGWGEGHEYQGVRSPSCHGATWHDGSCTHRGVPAPRI